MQDLQPLDPGQVIHARWIFQAMDDDGVREAAARRMDLSPEEQIALGQVMAERGVRPGGVEDMSAYGGIRGFVRRHWHGDFSLARSYWLHTFLLPGIVSALVVALLNALSAGVKARHTSLGALLVIGCVLATVVWSVVGTWSSAGKHKSRGGSGFWSGTVRVLLVVGVLGHSAEFVRLLPGLQEHWHVALGEQPGAPTQIVLRADGQSLLVRGGINDDTADAVSRALDQAPAVRMVVLESGGGWVRQGQQLAQVIARRGLATYVENECSSACTIAFLAGRERAADPDARLGFHAFRGVGGFQASSELDEALVWSCRPEPALRPARAVDLTAGHVVSDSCGPAQGADSHANQPRGRDCGAGHRPAVTRGSGNIPRSSIIASNHAQLPACPLRTYDGRDVGRAAGEAH